MFTGLIQQVGTLLKGEQRGSGARLTIRHEPWEDPLEPGESVAVSGACLTVTTAEAGHFTSDVLEETLRRTSLGGKRPGDVLNLERALRATDRLGGHVVQGHVDGVGRVATLTRAGPDWLMETACDADLLDDLVVKGSVACDGVSLTVTAITAETFSVHVIPYTMEHTVLGRLSVGSAVNVETDILGKYVKAYADRHEKDGSSLDIDILRRTGFA